MGQHSHIYKNTIINSIGIFVIYHIGNYADNSPEYLEAWFPKYKDGGNKTVWLCWVLAGTAFSKCKLYFYRTKSNSFSMFRWM